MYVCMYVCKYEYVDGREGSRWQSCRIVNKYVDI